MLEILALLIYELWKLILRGNTFVENDIMLPSVIT